MSGFGLYALVNDFVQPLFSKVHDSVVLRNVLDVVAAVRKSANDIVKLQE